MTDRHVVVDKVSRWYAEGDQQRLVLHKVSIDLFHGQAVALTGPSGSGKSTFLNLLAGIDRPDEGDIRIAGTSIVSGSENQRTLYRRRHIGLVFQAFNLLPTLTLFENVALPLQLNGVSRDEISDRVIAQLSQVGLADRREAWPQSCSGGEQQRVAIARALIHEPLLVLADEPTGNLDAANAKRTIELLLKLTRAQNGSLLIATHSRDVADQVDSVWSIEEQIIYDVGDGGRLDHLT